MLLLLVSLQYFSSRQGTEYDGDGLESGATAWTVPECLLVRGKIHHVNRMCQRQEVKVYCSRLDHLVTWTA